MANVIGFRTSKPIESLSADKKTKVWNMKDNKVYEIETLRYEQNMKQGLKLRNKKQNPVYSDWERFNYKVADYPGSERIMFHLKTGERIAGMTMELFDEIQRRNGPESNMKKLPNGEPFALWKLHITTVQSVKKMKTKLEENPVMEEIIERKVQEQVAKALAKSNKRSEAANEAIPESVETPEIIEKENEEIQEQPKKVRGRKKKS